MRHSEFDLWPYAQASLPADYEAILVAEDAAARRRWLPRLIGRLFAPEHEDKTERRPH
ncbi:MAG: hypothetical protein U1F33_00475 [Alphaproteobacteria bacterium]